MMLVLIAIALKSLFVALLALVLLHLMKKRSAAERSWIAHIGLLALVIMALAPLALPRWRLESPALFTNVSTPIPATENLNLSALVPSRTTAASQINAAPVNPAASTFNSATAATALYALPAAVLLLLTFLALARLIALRARAEVLVDGHWLSALARAQRRMGFKHGTALLTSNELGSPVSWGIMRPVILLNKRAVEAADDAEAIIAHELAHVARMDWLKLLLARFATALFWFNPLVWLLAREAHQLREEAADDSVLAANIVDTDYAQLLVGVARHECPGLLLGAHGVAPSRNSLARRVARVLDSKSARGPAAGAFAFGVLAGAVVIAAPLAALTVAPHVPAADKWAFQAKSRLGLGSTSRPHEFDVPNDLPNLIVNGISTSVTTATAAMVTHVGMTSRAKLPVTAPIGRSVETGSSVVIYPRDADGSRPQVAIVNSRANPVSDGETEIDTDRDFAATTHERGESALEVLSNMRALGVTPDYLAAIRAVAPSLTTNEIMELKAVGVTPDIVRHFASAGFGQLRAVEIEEARAVGMSPDYMRAMRSTGVPVTFNQLIELRAMGIRPDELASLRAAGPLTANKIHRIRVQRVPRPPQPPDPPSNRPDGG